MVAINEENNKDEALSAMEVELATMQVAMIAALGALIEGEYKDAEVIIAAQLCATKKDN